MSGPKITRSAADNAWAVGYCGTGTLALHWNGRTRKQVMIPQPGAVSPQQGVAVIPQSGSAWAVGGTGHGMLAFHWNGTAPQ